MAVKLRKINTRRNANRNNNETQNQNSDTTNSSSSFTNNKDNNNPLHSSSSTPVLMYPHFPDVKLKKLPFYKILATLLNPCSLQPRGTARFQEQRFSFYLSPSQASEISANSYRDSMGRFEYKRQIQLRFSLCETSCEQDDNFPSSICVKVNNKIQTLPNPIPTNKPGVEPRRPPKPINITALCKLSSTQQNNIDVSWAVEIGKGFTVSVYYADKLSSADLLKELKERGTRHPDYTRALIKEKLNDKDADLMTTSCKVTLACPLGKMRMSHPSRPSTCDHLQCFDANLFLMMNERKPKWLCPVCNKPALFDNLLIDGYFKEILSASRLPVDDHEIVLHNDGTWDPLPVKRDGVSSASPPPPASRPASADGTLATKVEPETVECVDDDDDSTEVVLPVTSAGDNGATVAQEDFAAKKTDADIVTLSSSEDEGEEEPRAPTRKRPRVNVIDDEDSRGSNNADNGNAAGSQTQNGENGGAAGAEKLSSKEKDKDGGGPLNPLNTSGEATSLNTNDFGVDEVVDPPIICLDDD